MAVADHFDTVQKIYIAFYQRPADPAGLRYWAQRVEAAGSEAAVIDAFANSTEATELYGPINNETIGEVIGKIYQALFNRAPDEAGQAFYEEAFANGELTAGNIALAILNAAQNDDVIAIENKLAVANEFTQQVDGREFDDANFGAGTSFQVTYDGEDDAVAAREVLAAVTQDPATILDENAVTRALQENIADAGDPIQDVASGQTFTLATTPDNIVGTSGDDVINGYINNTAVFPATTTLTAADVINGGAGDDSLKLVVEGTVPVTALPAATISSVENFFFRDVATAASTYDFANVQGEQQVWADTATNDVTFSSLGKDAVVGIKGNGVTQLGDVLFNMAAATDAVSIAIDGGVKNTAPNAAPNISATAGTATAATISSTGAANTVGNITLSGGTNTVKALNVDAATNLTAALVATDYAADAVLTVTGAGKVNLGAGFDGATIDASGNTGGLTISTTAGVTKAVTGSSATDTVTLVGALAASGTINLGAGDDKLLVGAGAAIGAKNVVDGGEGFDTISASVINAANAAVIKNFEGLDLTAATTSPLDVALITGSTIETLTLNGSLGGSAATVQNVAAGVGLTVAGVNLGTANIGVKDATTGTADSFDITFNGAAATTAPTAANIAAGTVVLNGVENVSIASQGGDNTWNSVTLTDSNLQVLTITGDKNLDVAFTGINGTNGAATGGAVNLIDGSAATGKLNINTTNVTADNKVGVGLTVKGGAADDTITLAQKAVVEAGAGNDTIAASADGGAFTGGAGNDKFDVSLAVSTGTTEATAVLSTLTDFAAGDSVKLLVDAATFVSAKVTLDQTVTNLDLALDAAASAANAVTWFQYGSDTYIVSNDGDADFNGGDLVVKLTGLVDLSTASLDAGTDYLTFA